MAKVGADRVIRKGRALGIVRVLPKLGPTLSVSVHHFPSGQMDEDNKQKADAWMKELALHPGPAMAGGDFNMPGELFQGP